VTNRLKRLRIIAVLVLWCAASGRGDANRSERPVVEVELLVFSGRENPRWQLTETEVDELIRRVRELPPGPPPPEPPGLGYGGFLITVSGRHAALPETMRVYRGVRPGPADTGAARQDERGLEQWLLELARQRTYGDLLDSLGL
jgi:hypothetical protein